MKKLVEFEQAKVLFSVFIEFELGIFFNQFQRIAKILWFHLLNRFDQISEDY